MTMLEVKTVSGRTYHVDVENQFWKRLPKTEGGYVGGWERIWTLQHGKHFDFPYNSPEGAWTDGLPVVGEFMYIASRDVWWVSTEVASITEIESPFDKEEED